MSSSVRLVMPVSKWEVSKRWSPKLSELLYRSFRRWGCLLWCLLFWWWSWRWPPEEMKYWSHSELLSSSFSPASDRFSFLFLKKYLYLSLCCDMGDLVSWVGVKPPALGAWCLSPWTTREVPVFDRFSGHADTALLIFSCLLLLWFLSALASHHWQLAALPVPSSFCAPPILSL